MSTAQAGAKTPATEQSTSIGPSLALDPVDQAVELVYAAQVEAVVHPFLDVHARNRRALGAKALGDRLADAVRGPRHERMSTREQAHVRSSRTRP